QPGTRGRFEEQGAHRGAGERGARVCRPLAVDEGLGTVEQRHQGGTRQVFEGEQVAQATVFRGLQAHAGPSGVWGRESGSTTTASPGEASQRSTMIAAATASSAAASRGLRRPSERSTAKRCAASTEL